MAKIEYDFLFENLISDMEKNGNYKGILCNLLAILNKDGGHCIDKHGITCSVIMGISNFHNRKIEDV